MRKKCNQIQGKPWRDAGFTMIELMVVLVILALVAVMVMPAAVSAMRRSGVNAEAEDLAELIRFAQRHAVTTRRPAQVNLDVARGRCWVSSITTALPWIDGAEEDEPQTLAAKRLPESILLTVESTETGTAAWKTITFDRDGCTDDAIVRLSDGRSPPVELLVVGTEGSVRQRESGA